MAKHSKFENERRAAETVRVKEIEAAWMGSLSKPVAEAFVDAVDGGTSPSAPGPVPEHAPGHAARTRPKREPRPTKEERNRRPARLTARSPIVRP